jgi:hypothetical protein
MATEPVPPPEDSSAKSDASIIDAQKLLIALRTLRNGDPNKWGQMASRFENLCASVEFLLEHYIVER